MNVHKNARTTPISRALIVSRVQDQHRCPRVVASELGISVRTVYKWLARFRAEGTTGLLDRSCAPIVVRHRLPESWSSAIDTLRRQHRMTAAQIAQSLKIPRSTVSAAIKRLGLNRFGQWDPKPQVFRYERQSPGDLLHLDIKRLGRFNRVGHRITGDHSVSSRGAGWDYAHVCVDDHSRLAYVELLEDQKGSTAVGFLRRALVWFSAQGITVRQIMTDNGSCYRWRGFARTCRMLRLTHIRTRPYTPRTNGKAERFIQTLQREWAYGRAYQTSQDRAAHLPRWLRHYNFRRPHGSLNLKPPISRIQTARVNNADGIHS